MKNWLADEFAWLGFILTAAVGGVVGFIKAYEQAGVELTFRQTIWGILRRVIMAGFAGWILYQFSIEYHWSNAWGHIMSGVTGMFAAEALELMWSIGRERLKALSGAKAEK